VIPGVKLEDLRSRLPVHDTKKYKKRQLEDIRSIALHHSLTAWGNAFSFARYHVNQHNWPGIGYAYVILKDGTVQWCWNWNVISYHVGSSNRHALGICFVGDYRKETVPPAQLLAGIRLVMYLKSELPNRVKVKGHSEFPGYSWKECPGPNFPLAKFKERTRGSSLIGKTVESETVMLIDGDLSKERVAIIDGRSYAPVRKLAESLGATVDWDGRVLITTKNERRG
jgi:N-acetyl-anhydromuramyl-L-alanine amidase AmpD